MPKHAKIFTAIQIGLLHVCVIPSLVEANQIPSRGYVKLPPVEQNYNTPKIINHSSGDLEMIGDNGKPLEVSGHLRGSIGYDTNIYEKSAAQGSPFQRYDMKLGMDYDSKGYELGIDVGLTAIDHFNRMDPNLWEFVASAKGKRTLNSGHFFGFDIGRKHDALDLGSATIADTAYFVMGQSIDLFEFELRGGFEHEMDRSGDASDDAGNFLNDVVSTLVEGTVRLMPTAAISPFLRSGFTGIGYTNPNGSTVNRNATGRYGVAGVRFQLKDQLKLDVGARMDNRQFKTNGVADAQSAFADINLVWNPVENLEFKGQIIRYLDNPDSVDSLYSQQTDYSLGMDWQLDKVMTLSLLGSLEQTLEPDIAYKSRDLTFSGEVTYQLSEYMGIFATFEQLWSRSRTAGDAVETYQRTEIRTGLEFKL